MSVMQESNNKSGSPQHIPPTLPERGQEVTDTLSSKKQHRTFYHMRSLKAAAPQVPLTGKALGTSSHGAHDDTKHYVGTPQAPNHKAQSPEKVGRSMM